MGAAQHSSPQRTSQACPISAAACRLANSFPDTVPLHLRSNHTAAQDVDPRHQHAKGRACILGRPTLKRVEAAAAAWSGGSGGGNNERGEAGAGCRSDYIPSV